MKSLAETFFGRVLGRVADAIIRRRWLFLWPQVFLFGLCLVYTKANLQIDADRNNLVGKDKKYHHNFLEFKNEFPQQDDLVVVVESENSEKNRQFVERLGAKIEVETNLFTDVLYRNDFKMLGKKALLFASESDLRDLKSKLTDYLPFIDRFTQATNLDSMFQMINTQIRTSKDEDNAQNRALLSALPMLKGIVDQARDCVHRPGTPPSPGIAALFGAGDQDIYITFASNRLYLVTAHAVSEEKSDAAVERLRDLVAQVEREVPGLNVGVTGESVLDYDEMAQSQKDSILAGIVSLIVCAVIFIYGYQETGRPLKATFCLVIGLGYTLAFTTLVVGHLNILTVTFFPILIGLAIDFGVHLITRYEEELRHGSSEEAAMKKAMIYTGQGIFTGAMTTAGAFLAMALTNFKGIQEMGIICGGGMVVCFIPMMTLLPVLLFRGRQNVIDHQLPQKPDIRSRIENLWLHRPITVTAVTVILCALSLTQFRKIYFDYDLLHMQSRALPAVVFEEKLVSSGSNSVIFGVVLATNAEQAIQLEKRIRQLPAVADVRSMAPRVTGDQSKQLELIGEIKKEISPICFKLPDPAPVRLSDLSITLYGTYGLMGQIADHVDSTNVDLINQILGLRNSIGELRIEMLKGDREANSEKLGIFQRALFTDVHDTFENLRGQDNGSPLRAADLPPALHNRYIGVTGKFLLEILPKNDIWQRGYQEEYVKELRDVDPNVTGTPVQLYEYTTLLKDSYQQAARYALVAIIIMVFAHFRTVSSVILALLPVAIGSIWLGGMMGYFNIPFNPANIMTLPLVIGIGVTNGIHILNRFAEEKNPGILSKSTGKAVFVSGLTAIAGFGSLMLAKHQGIQTLGYVMSLGVATCMIAALTFLPALLNYLHSSRDPKTKQPSGDNARSTLGREEPR